MNDSNHSLSTLLRGNHLPGLDGLRAVAVFMVMVYHFGYSVPGDLGVSAFFVLSGFLITWLLLKEHRASGDVSLRRFYMRRVLRIFPAYYVFIIASLVLDRLRGVTWPTGLQAAGLLYFTNYFNAFHGHPNTSIAHAWSLAIEEQFYLIWPLLFLGLMRFGVRWARFALIAIIAAVALWRSILLFGLGATHAYLYNAFDTRFDNLAVGCLLALTAGEAWFGVAARVGTRSVLYPVATLTLLGLSRSATGSAYHLSLGYTVDALLVAIFIVQILLLRQHRLWAWVDHPVVRYLGIISYPLYLWHAWALNAGLRMRSLPSPLPFLVGAGACVLVASGSYYLVEKPFLTLKKRFEPTASADRLAVAQARALAPS